MSTPRLADRLRDPTPLASVELRPPRAGLSRGASMDSWIDLSHSFRRFAAHDAYIFVTDNAVGMEEEENLQHLTTNLTGHLDPRRLVPFLTCKHTLEYCRLYATRARARGIDTLTVVGGDDTGGPPRCVPHAFQLREILRDALPDLALGGWANPHGDPERQADYVVADDFHADYLLTQIVSHHHLDRVEAFLRALEDADATLPVAFGVFYYPNARPGLLRTLGGYFPVPAEGIESDFEAGLGAAEICARTVVELRRLGVNHVYLSNLGGRRAPHVYQQVLDAARRV